MFLKCRRTVLLFGEGLARKMEKHAVLNLSDADILSRLTNTEDGTVERKTASDYRDCRKTVVAFSNSLPIGDPGVVFVGVYNDGRLEEDDKNLDSLQKN